MTVPKRPRLKNYAMPPRIFISYAQETEVLADWVLALAKKLRDDGIEAIIDRYFQWPETGWRPWMTEQIEQADWVLVVCTEEYQKRFDGHAAADVGRGVRWESQHITQELYDRKFSNSRFVPVLPPEGDEHCIPLPLKDYRKFQPDDQYEDLYRLLTDQPATPAPALGEIRRLPPLSVPELGKATPDSTNAPATLPNPYPGLAAFTPEQHPFFFGRDKDTKRVTDKLATQRFVSVVGRSGTGKSSLVAAGVEPALRQRHPALTYLRFKPQTHPHRQLAEALDRALPEERVTFGPPRAKHIQQLLEDDPAQAITDYLGRLQPPILLLADQFEELYTQTPEATAQRFRGVFESLRQHDALYLVLTLRSEFMDRLMAWLGGEVFAASLVPLEPVEGDERLRAVITRPAEESGVPVQPALMAALLPAAKATKGALPLIALTLQKLFEQRDPEQGLTLAAYEHMGGLESVVETAAAAIDEAIQTQPALDRACQRLFSHLATVIDELPARRSAEVEPLRTDRDVGRLIEALRAQGFVTDPDPQHIELAHETLLSHWPRLRDWCERYSGQLSLRRQAEQAAREWQRAREQEAAGQIDKARYSDILRWTWERQRPTLEALLVLGHLTAEADSDYIDPGIHAWRALENTLQEPLRGFLHPEPLPLLKALETDKTPHHRREEIGLRLNQMGDPRRGVGLDADSLPDIVWVDIRGAGEVTLEDTDPPQTFPVQPFRIAKFPITWAQYRAFLEAGDGYHNRHWWQGLQQQGQLGDELWGFANYPAINVSWDDAVAFCRWLSHKRGLGETTVIRPPTEWEWQWLTQAGAEAREYPWLGQWQSMRANSHESGIGRTAAVGMYPLGAPPSGVMDLAGNVWEWSLNEYYEPKNVQIGGKKPRVLRGGSWYNYPGYCRAAGRNDFDPGLRYFFIGFRVCCAAHIVIVPGARHGRHRNCRPTTVCRPRPG